MKTLVLIWFLVIACLIWWMLTGCTTAKKATRYMNEHPDVSAPFCADKYPVKEVYLNGDTVITYDTLWGMEFIHDTINVRGASVLGMPNNTFDGNPQSQTVGKKVPKYITKTLRIVDTIVKENTAKVKDAQIQLSKQISITTKKDAQLIDKDDEIKDLKWARNQWRNWTLWLAFLILAYALGRLKGWLK